MEDDPEYVEMVREALLADENFKASSNREEEKPKGPRLSDWNETSDGFADVIEELRVLREAVIAGAGGKPQAVKPAPRPDTALMKVSQSVKIEKREAKHQSVVNQLLPHKMKAEPDG